jgi:hypothetical protein
MPPSVESHELPPGRVAGVGQVIATPETASPGGRGLLDRLGFRIPEPGEIGRPMRGITRIAELIPGQGPACPEFSLPAAWGDRELAVSLAFVVDTNGKVDRSTLRVIESPGRPQTEHQFRSHIYVVATKARPERGPLDPAAYDSLVTGEVARHVAELLFRPALSDGRTVRATVLIACRTSPAG